MTSLLGIRGMENLLRGLAWNDAAGLLSLSGAFGISKHLVEKCPCFFAGVW